MAQKKKKDRSKRGVASPKTDSRSKRKKPVAAIATDQAGGQRDGLPSKSQARESLVEVAAPGNWSAMTWGLLAAGAALFLFSYWPTILWMMDLWYREPDYSHGWFVPLLCLSIAWHRIHSFPGAEKSVSYAGLWLIGLSIVMRIVGRFAYIDFFDAWSMLPFLYGVCWCVLGRRAVWWAIPAIGFLFFAFPLPYQAESLLSWKLQGIATELSKFGLRVLGQPAVSESHVIWIGTEQLIVEQACSGLRIFVGMGAFAVYWAAINDRSWSDRIFLLAIAIPAAIFVNSLRIILIGLLYPYFTDSGIRHWIHEFSGIIMLFASFGIMGAASWYWSILYRPEEKMTAGDYLRSSVPHSPRSDDPALGHPTEAS